jgi:cyclophilin family peptidyl-prolyl cis-trans isomerase
MKNLILIFSAIIFFACSSSNKVEGQSKQNQKSKKTETVKEETKPANDVELVELSTQFGKVLIWLYDETPLHKENFLKLTREGFYNGTTFHRIIQNFMIQGGDPNSKDDDPNNDGQGGPGYTIEAEIRPDLRHQPGAVAAARMGDQVNPQKRSSGSQFYIVQNPNGTPHLDNAYTVFGIVISGMDAVNTIAVQPKDGRDRPVQDIKMEVKIVNLTSEQLQSQYNFTVPAN